MELHTIQFMKYNQFHFKSVISRQKRQCCKKKFLSTSTYVQDKVISTANRLFNRQMYKSIVCNPMYTYMHITQYTRTCTYILYVTNSNPHGPTFTNLQINNFQTKTTQLPTGKIQISLNLFVLASYISVPRKTNKDVYYGYIFLYQAKCRSHSTHRVTFN